jgi:Cft2 family RNA processing exonuclease
MEIEFVGAAQTVTGSMHLVRTPHATLLLDCGLFQGHRRESIERNRNLPLPVKEIDAVILSHAHIDHSGALPLLVKQGYDGPIYATHATHDLCAAMLLDAANIQESDARFLNKQIDRGVIDSERVDALYTEADALEALERFVAIPYHRSFEVAKGVRVTFFDAGHVLGSAIVALDSEEDGRTRRLVFTGDLGRTNMPILRDPEVVPGAEMLITESTYGDRLHDPHRQDGRRPRGDHQAHLRPRRQGDHPRLRARAGAGDRLRPEGPAAQRGAAAYPGVHRLAPHGEDHRGVQDAPRVLRRGGPGDDLRPRRALRVRRAALHPGRRGQP